MLRSPKLCNHQKGDVIHCPWATDKVIPLLRINCSALSLLNFLWCKKNNFTLQEKEEDVRKTAFDSLLCQRLLVLVLAVLWDIEVDLGLLNKDTPAGSPGRCSGYGSRGTWEALGWDGMVQSGVKVHCWESEESYTLRIKGTGSHPADRPQKVLSISTVKHSHGKRVPRSLKPSAKQSWKLSCILNPERLINDYVIFWMW